MKKRYRNMQKKSKWKSKGDLRWECIIGTTIAGGWGYREPA